MAKKNKPRRKQTKRLLKHVFLLIGQYEDDACTQEALDKFAAIIVAEHGFRDGPDQIVVLGYCDPIECSLLDSSCCAKPTDKFTYDFSMEALGSALRKLGVVIASECDHLVLDEKTGKLVRRSQRF